LWGSVPTFGPYNDGRPRKRDWPACVARSGKPNLNVHAAKCPPRRAWPIEGLLTAQLPRLREYRFLMTTDQIVIVDPGNRSIALVIDRAQLDS